MMSTCKLVCVTSSHDPIDLPHLTPVIVGRSRATLIADKKVSREQVELTADHEKERVAVKQVGSRSGQVGDEELPKGRIVHMTTGTTLYLLAGKYPHTVQFTPQPQSNKEPKDDTRSTVDRFFQKKSKSNGKRRAEEEAEEETPNTAKRCKAEEEVTVATENAEDEDHMMMVQKKLRNMKETFCAPADTDTAGRNEPEHSARQGKPAAKHTWEQHDSLVIFTSSGVRASQKIAGFDIDGCIITTKSGKVFAQNMSDWKIQYPEIRKKLAKLVADSYKVVFFTNQMGIRRGKVKLPDFKEKVQAIVESLSIPIQVLIASGPGVFRKPGLGMWNYLREQKNDGLTVDMDKSFYVGDAAGRPEKWAPGRKKDFAISDRLFALNAGLDFHTPEEYFLGYRKAPFKMPEFDPRQIKSDGAHLSPASASTVLSTQEIIVNVGLPGSGKSHFSRQRLVKKGYVHVNRDSLGSWQKCVEATKRAIKEGRSVVVDNTNVDPESRKRYVDVAQSTGVSCRCFWFDISVQHCRHNERFREMTDKSHQAINDMIFNQTKSRFKAPTKEEGFTEIVKVNFVTDFKSKEEEVLYRQFLLEK